MLTLAAAVLTASMSIDIDLTALLRRGHGQQSQSQTSQVTCGITTVGYRFRGTPGQEFRYAGDTYSIPAEGAIELIADRRKTSYLVAGRTLQLDVFPRDQFGFREVPLPSSDELKGDSK